MVDTMQQREKILSILLVITLAGWMGWPLYSSTFMAPIEERQRDIDALQSQFELKEAEQLQVLQATRRLTDYRAEALPADPNAAQRAYTTWLSDLLDNSGWRSQNVLPGKVVRFQDIGSVVQVRIDGMANVEQLARFLSGFENAGLLHRLERITVQSPSTEPEAIMNVSLVAEAVSLTASTRDSLEDVSARPQLEEYWLSFAGESPFTKRRPVVVRQPAINVPATLQVNRGSRLTQQVELANFDAAHAPVQLTVKAPTAEGLTYDNRTRSLVWQTSEETEPGEYPLELVARSAESEEELLRKTVSVRVRIPNTPPQLENVSPQVLYPGEDWSLQLSASDRDQPPQRLRYSLTGTPPNGLTVDSNTGQLQWTPPLSLAGQSFRVEAVVTDDGDPPQKASTTVNLSVQRDMERATELIGCVQVDGIWTAWFVDREQSRRFTLKTGDPLKIGRFAGQIERIEVDRIVLAKENQQSEVLVGTRIADRQPLPLAEEPTTP